MSPAHLGVAARARGLSDRVGFNSAITVPLGYDYDLPYEVGMSMREALRARGCGLGGIELVLVLPALAWLHRATRARSGTVAHRDSKLRYGKVR